MRKASTSSSAEIHQIVGRIVPILDDQIDTDRIIPARFLKAVTFEALGPQLFYDERYGEGGAMLGHPLDELRFQGASILLTGENFGCGSSREHAPQALYRAGIRAVIAGSFAEIFFANSLALGLPCFTLPAADRATLYDWVEADPSRELRLQIDGQLEGEGWRAQAQIPVAAREAFESGRWDPLSTLLEGSGAVRTRLASFPSLRRHAD
ncbi:MAG: isopropylmalate isomerase [Myxococcota bacterium]|nr:isopropylmalate isomerase [Myxococcota bacterium]